MNKKGISMIIFVVAIAMLIVLTTGVTASYTVILNSTMLRGYGNELLSLQKAVEEYNFLNNGYPIKEEYVLDITLIDKNSRQEQFGITEGTMEFYIIDLNKLGIDSLSRGMEINKETRDFYAISKTNSKVYYLAGVKINDNYYYTLVDEIREKLDI